MEAVGNAFAEADLVGEGSEGDWNRAKVRTIGVLEVSEVLTGGMAGD